MRRFLDLVDGAIVACVKAVIGLCLGIGHLLVYVQMLAVCLVAVAVVGGAGFLALRALL
ncbi:hypothetical protein VB151_09400 [Xanthomonas fragariae]|uniref:hypothetical protein n=1 Tax=Xanthomonas fragariae TaxID=48664 RepID=UPI0012EAA818|nr:hypothetical protein [Xanthomonas fragariae]MBL9223084.1 hypothetical protein [Xanthomonas fragariae]MEA5219302.1 hypothetical protein [Xanthomonas fragariae]WIY74196.1 hypothetical protein OW158_20050 [Xanthomonas fragariae]